MADFGLILEAERRGILPEDKKAMLAEARSRGLVPGSEAPKADPLVEKMNAIDANRAAAEAREPGAGEYLWNQAKKGLAGFTGFSGDVTQMALDAGLEPAPHPALIPLTTLIRRAAEARGLVKPRQRVDVSGVMPTSKVHREIFGVDPNMTTENDALRYAGGVVEMAGAGGPMLAAKGVRALPLITSTVGAGIGLEAGGDIAEGIGVNRQAGEAVGAVAGGIVPSLTGSAGHGAFDYLKRRFSPSAQRASAEGAVAKELTPLVQNPGAQANLDRSLAVSDEFSAVGREFTPSLPARTASPGLLAMEKDLVTRNPASLEKAVANVQKNESEIAAFVNATFPAARETSVSRVAKLQKLAGDKLEAMRKAVDDKLDDLATVFERNPNNYEAGKQVRELVFKQKEIYQGTSRQKYQAVYKAADAQGVKVNIADDAQFADDVVKSEFNAYQQSEIPPVFRQLAKKTGKDLPEGAAEFVAEQSGKVAGEVSFAEFHSLLKRANGDIASLRGSQSVDRDFKLRLLNDLKTRLETKLTGFEEAGFGEVSTKLKEANRFYRDDYLPRFKQGFGGDVTARHGTGEFKTPNQEVVGMITKSNNAQAAKDFKLLFDDVPEAWQGLRDGYMDKLIREGNVLGADGKINQKVLDKFLRTHNPTLTEFPQIRNEFKQLALDNGALLERQGRILASQKELAAADIYKLFNGKDPGVVITEAVSNPNAMRVLVHKARNTPREGQALARAIADNVVQQADPVAYFAQNRDTIRTGLQALGKDHFKNIETAIEALTINQRSQVPKFVQSSGVVPDATASAIGSSPRALISHYINVARGRTGVSQELTAGLGRYWDKLRTDHKTVAMENVFYDKNVAAAFARLAKQPQVPKFRADFVNAMATLGIRAEIAGHE